MSYVNDDPVYCALQLLKGRPGSSAIADAWTRWFGSRPSAITTEPVWTSYRPFRKVRVVLRAKIIAADSTSDEIRVAFSARSTECAFRSEMTEAPDTDRTAGALSSFVIEPWRANAWVLPHVPRPAALPELMQQETLESMLPQAANVNGIKMTRFVPFRRALVQFSADGVQYFAKTFDKPDQYVKSAEALESVAGLPVRVPRLAGSAPEMRTLLMDRLSGRELSDYLLAGPLQPLAETGKALASVHRRVDVPSRVRTSRAELDDIKQLLHADLALVQPKLADRVEKTTSTLSSWFDRLGEVEPVAIHGSLFGDQVLFDPNAKCSIAFVDWDNYCGGDAHFDLGRLIAHLLFLSILTPGSSPSARIDALIAGYRSAGGIVDPERLSWHVVAALLLRAKISLLRTLASDWERHFGAILDEAEALLAYRRFPVGHAARAAQ